MEKNRKELGRSRRRPADAFPLHIGTIDGMVGVQKGT